MTDTPPTAQLSRPPPGAEQIKTFVGDLARPFAIISTSSAAAWATIEIAHEIAKRANSFEAAAIFIGAVYAGVGGLYGLKAWEKTTETKASGAVEVAKATVAPPAPGTAVVTAAADVTATVEVEDKPGADDGELPPDERVKL